MIERILPSQVTAAESFGDDAAAERAATVGLTRDVASLGVDAEPNEALPGHGMLDLIALDQERARLGELANGMPGTCWDRLPFCAKESVYKAWFPLARCWLGFDSADIVIDPHGARSPRASSCRSACEWRAVNSDQRPLARR